MKTNYHTHTTRCQHATGSDEEFVLSAIKGGFQVLGFSDHTPWKYRTNYVSNIRMLPDELPGYVESLRALREKYRDQIDIKIGLECEYFPEYISWLKEQVKEYKLDYLIFGNHFYHTDEKFPYFGRNTNNHDMLDLYEESAIEGMESGLFCCLAHPDLFMLSYPEWDHHCTTISRHICRPLPDSTFRWSITSAMPHTTKCTEPNRSPIPSSGTSPLPKDVRPSSE